MNEEHRAILSEKNQFNHIIDQSDTIDKVNNSGFPSMQIIDSNSVLYSTTLSSWLEPYLTVAIYVVWPHSYLLYCVVEPI